MMNTLKNNRKNPLKALTAGALSLLIALNIISAPVFAETADPTDINTVGASAMMGYIHGVLGAEPNSEAGRILKSLNLQWVDADTSDYSVGMFSTVAAQSDIEINDNAIVLTYTDDDDGNKKNISKITLSYLVGDNWVEITQENSRDLPVNTKYQFNISYFGINVANLEKVGGQMVFEGFPEWFKPDGVGALLFEGEIVAEIRAVDGKIVISFDMNWLATHESDVTLNGSFDVSGSIDWHELPGDGKDVEMPNVNVKFNFEDKLAQRYGTIDIEKSEPVLVPMNGKYYLKYILTVENTDTVPIPDVTVRDLFDNLDYVNGYVGVEGGLTVEGLDAPVETSDKDGFLEGKLSADQSGMLWDIGDLYAGETRTLTYYVEISDKYVSEVISNPIVNNAKLYSDVFLKDADSSSFKPKNDVLITKVAKEVAVAQNGNGDITYTVTISVPDDNSFVLSNLSFNDYFPEELAGFISGDNGAQIDVTVTVNGEKTTKTVDYNNASFTLPLDGITLAPNDEITIEYTVQVENIFLYNNGDVTLTNTAGVSSGSRPLSSAISSQNLDKNTLVRKIQGESVNSELTVAIEPSDGVYVYNGSTVSTAANPESSFTVPSGSLKYQVILNENGQWDLSSTNLKDKFDEEYLKYVGYVKIELFEDAVDDASNKNDEALAGELEKKTAAKTVWLKVDNRGDFAFKPEELGINDGKNYTYLLTYYAKPVNTENIVSATVSNSFGLWGELGYGDGDGTVGIPNGIEVSVSNVVTGGVTINAEKTSWYYEPKPVYKTEAVGSTYYKESDFNDDYKNGAIYWVIRFDEDIPEGTSNGRRTENNTGLSGFMIKDTPDPAVSGYQNKSSSIKRDSLVGIYVAPKDFDFSAYDSYADVEAFFKDKVDSDDFKKLIGNPCNDKWFDSHNDFRTEDEEYFWYAENAYIDGIVFPSGVDIGDNQAVFIVLRTAVTSLPTGNTPFKDYDNVLQVRMGDKTYDINKATYTIYNGGSVYKESKGAFTYNKSADTFTPCSDRTDKWWSFASHVDKEKLDSSGTYAVWLLNINWDGSMSGTADVIDYLPKGMELLYVGVNNYGGTIKNAPSRRPQFEYISGLDGWQEIEFACTTTTDPKVPYTTISYYNPETREIRWRVNNLESGGEANQFQINLKIICRVVDPELFLNANGKTYINDAALLDPQTGEPYDFTHADVTIKRPLDKKLDEATLRAWNSTVNGDNIKGALNRLPFIIEINPLGEDMCEGNTLPALIDVLSEHLILIEDSLKIYADGTELSGCTYSVEKQADGKTHLIINGLPDNVPLEIKYNARVDTVPNVSTPISNEAYWAGYDAPDTPQVNDKNFEYNPSGEVFVTDKISIEINKVDAGSHSKKLDGASFTISEVKPDGTLEEIVSDLVTDSYGKVKVDNTKAQGQLKFDTVYCIEETTAPSGYTVTETTNKHYFVIINPKSGKKEADFSDYKKLNIDIDFWYDDPNYSIVIENYKGDIGVEKEFVGTRPTSGRYNFGLFDKNGVLLQTLTIEYTETGEVYYLDDVPKTERKFTKYDPHGYYSIFELDENKEPIMNYGSATLNETDYRVSYEGDNENVFIGKTIKVTNDPNAGVGNLCVAKTVAQPYIDAEQEFNFTVTLTKNGQLALINETYGDLTFVNGVATFTLKHNEQKTATGLPAGLNYTVEETAADGYKTTWTKKVGTNDAVSVEDGSGEITADITDEITATNEYKKGGLSVKKDVVGDASYQYTDSFTFEVTFTVPNGFALSSPYSYKVGNDTKTMTLTKNDNGSYSGTLTISNGQTATIDGLPVGTKYKVEETDASDLVLTAVEVDGTAVSGGIASGTITYDDTKNKSVISAVTMTNATPVSTSVTLKKTLSGPVVGSTPKIYSFNVTRTSAKDSAGVDLNIPAYTAKTATVTVEKGTADYTGTASVILEEYKVAGTYTYEISEVNSNAAGVTYDKIVYTVTVVVTVESDGSLKATANKTKPVNGTATAVEGDLEFTNLYSATGTFAPLSLRKTLATSGGISVDFAENDFLFKATVSPANGASFADTTDGEITLSATKTANNSADGSVLFGDITFTKSGTYTVTVNEEPIPAQSSVYGNADAFTGILTAVYDVRDVNGELKVVSVTYGTGNDAFTVDMTKDIDAETAKKVSDYLTVCNTYKTGGLTISKTVETSDGSTLAGAPLTDSFEFTVELYMGTETNKSPVSGSFTVSGTAVLPSLTEGSGTLTFGTDGKATVKLSHGQTLTIAGIPVGAHYKVTETPFAQDSNYSVKQPTDGTIEGNIAEEGATASFVNVYTMPPAKLSIPVQKTVIGANALNTYSFSFTFDLATIDNAPLPTDTELTLSFADTDASADKWTKSDSFGEITFERAGTYHYTVTERSGSADGIRYDTVTHNVTVDVQNIGGVLAAHIIEIDGKTVSAADDSEPAVSISNYYRYAAFSLNGTKTVSGPLYDRKTSDGTANNSETFMFTVSISAPEGFDYANAGYTASQDDRGATTYSKIVPITVTADNASGIYQASEKFIDDEYHIAGTYTYTVKETVGNTSGFTYDETVYTITVEVEEQTDYTLSVFSEITAVGDTAVTDTDGKLIVAFNNTYAVANGAAVVPDIHKVLDDKSLSGRVLKNGEFGFTATVTLPDGSTAYGAGFIAKDADGSDIISPAKTVRNDEQGNVTFGGLTFTRAGKYILTIKEDIPEEAAQDPLIKYDDRVVTITYEVTDNGGALSVTQSGVPELIGRTFINTIEESQGTEPPIETDPPVSSEPSETSASTSDTSVSTSETSVSTSETTVSTSETTVSTSETSVSTSETSVSTSETSVSASDTTVSTSETSVSTSETTAPTPETTSPTSETTAPTSEATAPTSESSATTSNSTVTTPNSSVTSNPPAVQERPTSSESLEEPSNPLAPEIERPAESAVQEEESESEVAPVEANDANPSTGSRCSTAPFAVLAVAGILAAVSVKQRKNRQA